MASIIDSTDFTSNAGTDNAVTLVRTPITISYDIDGNETITEGSTNNITVNVFNLNPTQYTIQKYGLMEQTTGYLMVGGSETINKDDKITFNGIDYRVINVRTRGPSGSTAFYKFCQIQIIE